MIGRRIGILSEGQTPRVFLLKMEIQQSHEGRISMYERVDLAGAEGEK